MKHRRMPPRYKSGPKKGQFMPKAARRRKARRNPVAAANPRPKRRRRKARRNPMIGGRYVNLRAGGHTGTRPKRRKAAKKRTGGTTVAKRRKHRKAKRSHRSYVLAGKKAARTRATKKAHRRAAAKKSHRKTRRHVTRRRHRKVSAAPKRRRRSRRHLRTVTAKRGVAFRARPKRGRKYRRYRVRARYPKRLHGRVRFSVRRNPTAAGVKGMLIEGAMLYGGMLGMRALSGLIRTYVTSKITSLSTSTGTMAQVGAVLPAIGAFAFGLFAPKFIKNAKLLQGVQAGAALVLFDSIFKTFIQPSLPASVQPYLAGGMGFYGGEYIAQRPRLPMMGTVAREAMAEYVQQPGMGAFDVNEALADSEVHAMQTGYAGGSLARTLFSS